MTESVTPLPCPFCGDWWSEAARTGPMVREGKEGREFVFCSACGAEGPWVANNDTEAAVMAWNTRSAPAPQVLAGEAVKRYEPCLWEIGEKLVEGMDLAATGDYVLYTDHLAQMQAKPAASVDMELMREALTVQKAAVELYALHYKEYPDHLPTYTQVAAARLKAFKKWIAYFEALALLTTSEKKENGE